MAAGALHIVPAELPLAVTASSEPASTLVHVERVPTPMEEFTQTITESLLRTLVPLIASDPNKQVEARFMKFLPPHRRKRGCTINKICRMYLAFAKTYYRKADGKITSEVDCISYALATLRELYGGTRMSEFGAKRLKAVRERMIAKGWCRNHVNAEVGRVKRMVRWGVENELIPSGVLHALESVRGLQMGRSAARESFPVKPAPEEAIAAVLARVSTPIRAMIQLQLLPAMRPGEVCIMRPCDIDRTTQPWVYRPQYHKTAHHNHERMILLGPKTQQLLLPFLAAADSTAFVFCPREAVRERYRLAHEARVTPLAYGNVPGSNRKRHPKRKPGKGYNPAAYNRAVRRACQEAFPLPDGLNDDQVAQWKREHYWHPHQLRHSAATRLRKQYGLDIAQVILGHKTLTVTQVYAEKDMESAQRVMAEAG